MSRDAVFARLREEYHRQICSGLLGERAKGVLSCADKASAPSARIARGVAEAMGHPLCKQVPKSQTLGSEFTHLTLEFLEEGFKRLAHLRPGKWEWQATGTRITGFDQYEHLDALDALLQSDAVARSALGSDYLITPDIVVSRLPVPDREINRKGRLLLAAGGVSRLTPLRDANANDGKAMLHASISCKWTMRSDRAQNTRTEALNLIRNRKGATPKIAAVTMEPMPSRLASIAMGTGDIDCVYHAALDELVEVMHEAGGEVAWDLLSMLIEGRRLRDISDLPFDLAI